MLIKQYLYIIIRNGKTFPFLMIVIYTFVSLFAIIFLHKNTAGENGAHPLLQKEKRKSAKSDISKVFFQIYKKSLILPSREYIDLKYLLTTAS